MLEDKFLQDALRKGDRDAFSIIFKRYYRDLTLFAGTFIKDQDTCEDIVQSVFLKLWDEHKKIQITSSIKSFLLKSVQNRCYDLIRHRNVIDEHRDYWLYVTKDNEDFTENYVLYSELNSLLEDALQKIPDGNRQVFVKNKMEGFKYKEIAKQLGVSERTVEVRISKTLTYLRQYLKEFVSCCFAFFASLL